MEAPRIVSPETANLGITESWLKAQVHIQKPESFAKATRTTVGQQALFETKFADLKVVGNAVPDLWHYVKFDDYPGARVRVDFLDGSKLEASTHSYYVFMIPWRVDAQDGETFNADISRAVSALLPPKTVNKERLARGRFTFDHPLRAEGFANLARVLLHCSHEITQQSNRGNTSKIARDMSARPGFM